MAKALPLYKLTHTNKPLRASAPVLLVRLTEMMEWAQSVHDPANVDELHAMRIAAKRLRYTMELFAPVLEPADEAEAVLALVADIQERLGLIHDCDVLIPLLEATMHKEMEREKKKGMRKGGGPPVHLAAEGLSALMQTKGEERTARYHDFIAFWDALPPQAFAARVTRLVSAEGYETPDPSPDRAGEGTMADPPDFDATS